MMWPAFSLVEMGWQSAWVEPPVADRLVDGGLCVWDGRFLKPAAGVSNDSVWELIGTGRK